MIKIIQVDFEPKVYQVNMEAGATNLETALEPVGEIVLAIRGMGTFKHY